MNSHKLGRLKSVDLRDVWKNEASNFTPWLASEENLKLLGDALFLELQLVSQEKAVGPFRADIVCKDTSDDSWVLIENQLATTDHTHLGQIMTYAAGLDAVTIIWIAGRFTDEHRASLDWLNKISADNIRFFGLEIELWKIGDSTNAPKFNIIAKPNDWTKGAGRIIDTGLTEAKKLQLEFWHGFHEYIMENSKLIKPTKAQPHHWMNISIGRSGFRLRAIASLYNSDSGGYSENEIRAELDVSDKQNAKHYFEMLENDKTQIELEIGESPIWHNPDSANACRIYLKNSADLYNLNEREKQYKWLLCKLELLHNVFSSRVKTLELKIE